MKTSKEYREEKKLMEDDGLIQYEKGGLYAIHRIERELLDLYEFLERSMKRLEKIASK